MTPGKRNAREVVVDRLLETMEKENLLPWKMSWFSRDLPYNATTMRRYRGTNVIVLWALGMKFKDKGFMTYKQAEALGAKVRTGEHGFPVLYATSYAVPLADEFGVPLKTKDGELRTKDIWMNRYFTVFNVEQIEGLPEREQIEAMHRQANDIIAASGAKIEFGEDPAYHPTWDYISIPRAGDFATEADYYAACFHELIHWTGAESRLKRGLGGSFGSEKYSKEELIAEIGAAFLMAECGLAGTEESNAAYVKGWLERLHGDKSLIITAATAAQKAVDYLLSLSETSTCAQCVTETST